MRYIDLGFCTEAFCGDALPVVIPEKILKGHASLFSFLNADLVSVDSALEKQYASGDPGEKETVFNMISSLHPWFSMNRANASALMNRAAAAYAEKHFPDDKKSFFERFYVPYGIGACSSSYWFEEDPSRYRLSPGDALLEKPLLSVQRDLREMAVVLLDSAPPARAGASPRERLAVYGLMRHGAGYQGFVKASGMRISYGFVQTVSERRAEAVLDFAGEHDDVSYDNLCTDVSLLNGDPNHPAPVISCLLPELINLGSGRASDEVLCPQSLLELLSFEIFEMFRAGEQIKRGAGGEFPVPGDDGAAMKDESVKAVARALYNKAYKAHFNRIENGAMTKEDLDAWRKEAREMLKKTIDGKISTGELAMYLTN